ncbi:MAG: MotA/TolQ/ExbB proton channel family protein [Gammaproteobacteria bacterium]|nr:MAG: MotA/TolQ/ExbB proton channel family protein [Gammaproteobacteria bacterium]
MVLIVICSIVALAITGERLWSLQRSKIVPRNLVAHVWHKVKNKQMDSSELRTLRESSALGRMLAAGLSNINSSREVMKDAIEDVGRHEAHKMERFLNTLGIIAVITPLLGLLGTVLGMMSVFAELGGGSADPKKLAMGINEALYTTAGGMMVAIPALMAYRFLRGKVEGLIVYMEQEALKLIEVIISQRAKDKGSEGAEK